MNSDSFVILGLDPGSEESSFVLFDSIARIVIGHGSEKNDEIISYLQRHVIADVLVIEKIANMGMAAGASLFETAFYSGMFAQAWSPRPCGRLTRHQIKMHLCGSMRAKDANIRQALIDKLGPVGTKKNQGPCYGISKHLWSALAVAVTYAETHNLCPSPETKTAS